MFATRLWWVSITPFGLPVVPLEYGSTSRVVLRIDGRLDGGRRVGREQLCEWGGPFPVSEHEDLFDPRFPRRSLGDLEEGELRSAGNGRPSR